MESFPDLNSSVLILLEFPHSFGDLQGKAKHKHKLICGIVPGLGWWQTFVYVFLLGSFLMGEKNTSTKSPRKS